MTTLARRHQTSVAFTLSGKLSDIHIQDVRMRDLSSNGIGVFGSEDQPARDVWVTDVVIDHCCNTYADYLEAKPGPEAGSKREDQGLICFYRRPRFRRPRLPIRELPFRWHPFLPLPPGAVHRQPRLHRQDGRLFSRNVPGRLRPRAT